MKKLLFLMGMILLNVENLPSQEQHLFKELKVSSAISRPVMESEFFHLINQHRADNLLSPLKWASTPAHVARKHSLNMARGLVPFGHQGADLRFDEVKQKIPSTTRFGENVAYNQGYANPVEVAVKGLLASPGHYSNIMGDYNISGVGVALNLQGEYYFTQIFVKVSSAALENIETEVSENESYDFYDAIEFRD